MASSETPLKVKDDEQVPVGFRPFKPVQQGTGPEPGNCLSKDPKLDTNNGETVKSTPPTTSGNNTLTANKRKREPVSTTTNDDKETESANVTPIVNTTETSEKHVTTIETTGAKEVGMKDAEKVYTKEVEMQDAEAVYSKTSLEEQSIEESAVVREEEKTQPNTNENDVGLNSNTTEQPTKFDESGSDEKQSIKANSSHESGQQVLGEVATLLKQVEESDAKAKLEVEVKVKKLDQNDVKENGEAGESQTADRVS